jgi:NRPS condensation-like uncharacterized protein
MGNAYENSSYFKAEIFDKIQFLFEEYKYNDHQLHCVISFNNRLNRECIKRAFLYTLDAVPILGCRYIEDDNSPYWERIDKTKFEDAVVFINENTTDVLEKVITSRINELEGPQVKIFVLTSYKDTMCILMNHMICDAAGFKEYLYLLCTIYSGFIKIPEYIPVYKLDVSRSVNQIIDRFNAYSKVKALFSIYSENKQKNTFCFPMDKENKLYPFILTYRSSQSKYNVIKKYSKKYNVTVNDIVLASYYRALSRLLNIPDKASVKIPFMIDLRRYLANRGSAGLCNLTSIMPSSIIYNSKDTFHDTVMKVNATMNIRKNSLQGVGDLIKLSTAFKFLPYRELKSILKLLSLYPQVTLTNIGVLDSKKLQFSGMIIKDVFMTGSIKYPPFFQLAVTTYDGKMTFSVNLHGSEQDKKNITDFFIRLNDELPTEDLL